MTERYEALARLVGDPERFVADTFGRAPLHVPATTADASTDLLTLDDVDRIVASTALRAPSFRLVRDGVTLPRTAVTRSVRIGSRPVDDLADVRAVHREFAAGASIVLQGLHRSFAPVAELCRGLEVALTHPVQANAYLTPPVAQGLHLHGDPHDVFAVQTHGVKRWVVHPPDGSAPWDLELAPGDVLYLPAGTRHAAQTTDHPSLHLTLGVRTTTLRDAVRAALDAVLDDEALDAPLPAGWADDPATAADALRERIVATADRLRATDPGPTLDGLADTFWVRRISDLDGGLRDLLELDGLDDATPLRRRRDATFRARVVGDRVRLQLGAHELTFPSAAADVLARIAVADRFVPADLDDVADLASRMVLCRRLVREGALAIDRTEATGPARA